MDRLEAIVVLLVWVAAAAAVVSLAVGAPIYSIAFGVLALLGVEMTS